MAGENHRQILGDYFTLRRGTTYKSQLLGQPGPVLLGLATIQRNGGFRADSLKTYGGDCPANLIVQPGELYLSLKDVTQSADLLGAVARLPRDHAPGRLTQDTVKLEPKGSDVPLDYLYWVLRTPQYRNYCRAHATGTTNLGLARDDFLAFSVPEPTTVQQKIVDTLGALDDKIELNRRMNATLEAMARALFKSWFVDFDPVRAKMEGRWRKGESLPGLPAHLYDLFPDSFEEAELGEIPRGWPRSTVGKHFKLTMGQSPPGSTYNESGDGLPFFQGRTDFGFRFPSRRVFCTAPTRLAEGGDTLVCVRAPVGDVNIAIEPCAIGRGVAAVRHLRGSRSFTYHAMHNLGEYFGKFEGEGTVFGSINKADFECLPFVVPPQDALDFFERIASPIDDRIESNENESRILEMLRNSLLPSLLSGELRILDTEQQLQAQVQ